MTVVHGGDGDKSFICVLDCWTADRRKAVRTFTFIQRTLSDQRPYAKNVWKFLKLLALASALALSENHAHGDSIGIVHINIKLHEIKLETGSELELRTGGHCTSQFSNFPSNRTNYKIT